MPTSRKAQLKDLTSERHLPSMRPLITVNLCHTQRHVTVAVHSLPSLPAGRIIHLREKKMRPVWTAHNSHQSVNPSWCRVDRLIR